MHYLAVEGQLVLGAEDAIEMGGFLLPVEPEMVESVHFRKDGSVEECASFLGSDSVLLVPG